MSDQPKSPQDVFREWQETTERIHANIEKLELISAVLRTLALILLPVIFGILITAR